MQYLDVLQRNQTNVGHPGERRKEVAELILLVDEFDDERQVAGQIEDGGALDVAAYAEADDAAQNRGASDVCIARFSTMAL